PTEALACCRAIISVARCLDDEPTSISQGRRMLCLYQVCGTAQHILASGEAGPLPLAQLQTALADADAQDTFVVAIRGERAMMHELCSCIAKGTVKLSSVLDQCCLTDGCTVVRGKGEPDSIWTKLDDLILADTLSTSHAWMLRHCNAVIA